MFLRQVKCYLFICFVLFPVMSFSEEFEPLDSPPQDFSAISGEIQVVPLRWSMHNNTKVLGYVIYRADSKGGDFKEIAKLESRYITSYLDGKEAVGIAFKLLSKVTSSLLDNKIYYYQIATITGEDTIGKFSEDLKATTAQKPSMPLNFQAFNGGARVISLNWMPPNDKTVVGYRIYRKNGRDGELLSVKEISRRLTISFVDKGREDKPLENGHEYYYAISSINQADVESYVTKVISAKTKNVPPAVKNITASKENVRHIEVNWEASKIPDLKHYVILKKRIDSTGESDKEIKIPAGTTVYLDENLRDGTRYHYEVKVVDIDDLESEPSLTASGTTKNIPTTPKNIRIAMSDDKVLVTWDKSPEPDIEKYEVYKMSGFIGIMRKLGITKKNSFVDRDVKRGNKFSYRIVAVDKDNLKSEKSKIISIRIPK